MFGSNHFQMEVLASTIHNVAYVESHQIDFIHEFHFIPVPCYSAIHNLTYVTYFVIYVPLAFARRGEIMHEQHV